MKSQLTWNHIQTLERIFHQSPRRGRTWRTEINDLWQRAIAFLAASDEPHVWRTQNTQGQTVWNAYDPRTGQTVNQISESELRVWLEERYDYTYLV